MHRTGTYGKWFVVLVLCFFWLSPGQAQDNGVDTIINQTPAGMKDFSGLAKGIAQGRPARLEEFENLARQLARQEQARIKNQAGDPPPIGTRLLLFVTLGDKPQENLAENQRLFKDIREVAPDATVVLRGLPQGAHTLDDLFLYVRRLINKHGPPVILDPQLFRRYAIKVSPTLMYERDGVPVAWARGIINTRWLKRQVEREKATGDLGKWGQTTTIAERDLIEEIKSRLAGIDWDQKKKQAWAGYWQHYQFVDLPKARKEKVFYLDATYRVPKDFILPDGKVIARAGQKIDLFKIMPPTFALVVFDAVDPAQVAWAVKTGKEYGGKYRVKYITTRIPDRDRGWKSYTKVSKTLDAPLYLLNDVVRDRFKLAHVPSTVRFDKAKHQFEVKEIAPLTVVQARENDGE